MFYSDLVHYSVTRREVVVVGVMYRLGRSRCRCDIFLYLYVVDIESYKEIFSDKEL